MMPPEPEDVAHQIASATAGMREMFAPIDESALGYKKHLISIGWSSSAAESMAVEYHRLLISMFVKGVAS